MSVSGLDGQVLQARSWRVWDAPTRIMHWLLVIGIAVCWWTGEHNQLQYHLYSGYVVLWVVLLRLYWGVAGSSTARFANFVRGPKAVAGYARGLHKRDAPHSQGHNPLGAISVVAMLVLVLAVVVFGLFAVDVDGLYSGPLSGYVDFHAGRQMAHRHYRFFTYLLWLIGLHIAAVIFYYVYKRQDLVFPMITGERRGEPPREGELRVAPAWRLAVGAALAAAIVWLVTTGFYF